MEYPGLRVVSSIEERFVVFIALVSSAVGFDESKSAALFEYTPEVKVAVQTGLSPTQATIEQFTPTGQWSHCLMLAMSVHVR